MIADEAQARDYVVQQCGAASPAIERLEELAALLAQENAVQNLVSAQSLGEVWRRHIADSIQLLAHVSRETAAKGWFDLGTGAGFPGLAIACVLPDSPVWLVESRARRIDWLRRAAAALGLGRVEVIGQTLEKVPTRHAGVISARAFAPLDKLLRLSARFSTSDTIWLLPKGRSARQELAELTGWQHAFHVEQSLTDHDAGIVVGHLIGASAAAKAGMQAKTKE